MFENKFLGRIEQVIKSGILNEGFPRIPNSGATDKMIENEEKLLPRPLSEQHKVFLKKWNGANLDFMRVLGTNPVESEFMEELAKEYLEWKNLFEEMNDKVIYFANDVSGFMYFELEDGSIVQLDTDGGEMEKVAKDINDFFLNYLFGERANEFMEDWLNELKKFKIL